MTAKAPPPPIVDRPHDFKVPILCTLWTRNAENNMHWREKQDKTNEARFLAREAARKAKVPPIRGHRVSIDCLPLQARGRMADPGAHECVAKACIDGLRDAGVLVDDTGDYVANVNCLPPQRTTAGAVGMILYLTVEQPHV